MVLWASALSLAASSAGLVMLGSNPILGELSGLGFAVSLFIMICASEALNEGSRARRNQFIFVAFSFTPGSSPLVNSTPAASSAP